MASAISRFRNRANLPKSIEVEFPADRPEMTFFVTPFSMAERQGATWAAERALAERGIQKPDGNDKLAAEEYQAELNVHFFAALGDIISKHITGWKHEPTDGEPLHFSQPVLRQLFDEMTLTEKMQVGLIYSAKLMASEKKKDDESPKGSENA